MEESFAILCDLSKRLSYKPGYSFLVSRVDDESALVSLRCPSLPHSQQEGEDVGLTINTTVKLSTIVTPSDGLFAFANVVANLELHESAEWFKVDDRQVFLPHGWGDEFGGFKWDDFMNLSGKFLSALSDFMK